jgi:ABC-type transporter Mla maintaining outer membrane lipid asymmetry ATPase subunit MlaF
METAERTPVISVEHLIARFGGNTVFDDISFDIRKGEIFVILGGSGCGKTTMLKHITTSPGPTMRRWTRLSGISGCSSSRAHSSAP